MFPFVQMTQAGKQYETDSECEGEKCHCGQESGVYIKEGAMKALI